MEGRRSKRLAAQSSSPASSQPNSSPKTTAGAKRKSDANTTPMAKRSKKASEPEQKTIEQTMDTEGAEQGGTDQPTEHSHTTQNGDVKADQNFDKDMQAAIEKSKVDSASSQPQGIEVEQDAEMEDADESVKEHADVTGIEEKVEANGEQKPDEPSKTKDSGTVNATEKLMEEARPQEDQKPEPERVDTGESAVEEGEREMEMPSNILEKGIIYFFFRARVNVEDPHDTNDIARSYMIMRPIPHGAKLGDGPIGDDGNCRLLALPKKVLPISGKDRFMVFVEKAKTSFKDLKENFLGASDYATKTAGTSHTPPVTPIGEGIYAITTTGRESHLAYILTIPNELNEVQKDIGLRERGSFVTSLKNPEQKGPANASLGKSPDWPKEYIDEFRGLRWMPVQPKYLDYANAQLLLIGESSGLDKATEAMPRDEKQDKETPLGEMEKLEGEDEIRVKHLKGDDAIFADLGLSAKEYPKVLTTW